MAKKTKSTRNTRNSRPTKKANGTVRSSAPSARIRTFKPNGGLTEATHVPDESSEVPIAQAIKDALEVMGDITIDDGLAASQLRQLAVCLEDVVARKAEFNQKNEAAKVAKKSVDSATELLLEKLRSFTHPTPLPLFDQAQAEQDVADMLDADALAE